MDLYGGQAGVEAARPRRCEQATLLDRDTLRVWHLEAGDPAALCTGRRAVEKCIRWDAVLQTQVQEVEIGAGVVGIGGHLELGVQLHFVSVDDRRVEQQRPWRGQRRQPAPCRRRAGKVPHHCRMRHADRCSLRGGAPSALRTQLLPRLLPHL